MYPELVLLKNTVWVSLTPVFNVSYHLIAFVQLLHYQSTKCCEWDNISLLRKGGK